MSAKKTILFHRDFAGFTGGHLKVWDYYCHVRSSDSFRAEIYFTAQSIWENNPWSAIKDRHFLQQWQVENADVLFLAGMDWLALSEEQRHNPPAPVINFIQHVRHADRECPLYQFLQYPATRICVSQEVTDALNETGIVNGDIITISNGIDMGLLPKPQKKDIPLLILGLKNVEFANRLSAGLSRRNIAHRLLVKPLAREQYLSLLNRADICVFLPHKTEGFYLPALEAMLLKTLVICPDCVGNRGFCMDHKTCLSPAYQLEAFIEVLNKARHFNTTEKTQLLKAAFDVASGYSLKKERHAFLKLLSKQFL